MPPVHIIKPSTMKLSGKRDPIHRIHIGLPIMVSVCGLTSVVSLEYTCTCVHTHAHTHTHIIHCTYPLLGDRQGKGKGFKYANKYSKRKRQRGGNLDEDDEDDDCIAEDSAQKKSNAFITARDQFVRRHLMHPYSGT